MTVPTRSINLPRHIAIIMDGNGRWAIKHRLPRLEGHRRGATAASQVIENCITYGIPYITLYVFSTENWLRPKTEVEGLFSLLQENLDKGINTAIEKGARIHHQGKLDGLPELLREKIKEAEKATSKNTNITVVLAFNYGARDEILQAIRTIVSSGIKPEQISESLFCEKLYSAGIPDPDLIIRTGGEMRLSNFLLWQAAYAEIYFTPVLWPDFDRKELDQSLAEYRKRQRRFGSLPVNEVES